MAAEIRKALPNLLGGVIACAAARAMDGVRHHPRCSGLVLICRNSVTYALTRRVLASRFKEEQSRTGCFDRLSWAEESQGVAGTLLWHKELTKNAPVLRIYPKEPTRRPRILILVPWSPTALRCGVRVHSTYRIHQRLVETVRGD